MSEAAAEPALLEWGDPRRVSWLVESVRRKSGTGCWHFHTSTQYIRFHGKRYISPMDTYVHGYFLYDHARC